MKPIAQPEGCSSLVHFSKELLPAHLQAPCLSPVHMKHEQPGGARQEEARHGFLGTSLFGRLPPGALITTQPSALLLGSQLPVRLKAQTRNIHVYQKSLIYFWLFCVSVAVRLSSSCGAWGLLSSYNVQASRCSGFSCGRAQVHVPGL